MISSTVPQEADLVAAEILLAAPDLFLGPDGTVDTEVSGMVAQRINAICGASAEWYDRMIRRRRQ